MQKEDSSLVEDTGMWFRTEKYLLFQKMIRSIYYEWAEI
jgi:hypothetical protein